MGYLFILLDIHSPVKANIRRGRKQEEVLSSGLGKKSSNTIHFFSMNLFSTVPIKYLNTYKRSDLSEPETVCKQITDHFDSQLSSAHFDTYFVALQCCLADLWALEWFKVKFQKL